MNRFLFVDIIISVTLLRPAQGNPFLSLQLTPAPKQMNNPPNNTGGWCLRASCVNFVSVATSDKSLQYHTKTKPFHSTTIYFIFVIFCCDFKIL